MTTLTDHQALAARTIVAAIKGDCPQPLTQLAGFAGTGKSTILPHIIEDLGFDPFDIAFMAPTGKAAKVMRNKLKDQGYPNQNAGTIHSWIYRQKPAPVVQLEQELHEHQEALAQARGEGADQAELDKYRRQIMRLEADLDAVYRNDEMNFQLAVDSPLVDKKLAVVDESSMVGRRMADDLMSFGIPVLAIGDPGQLPPVNDEEGLTAGRPDFFLTEIHRQAKDNPIIHVATLARSGEDIPIGSYGDAVKVMSRRDFDAEPILALGDKRPQLLCGTNKTRWRNTRMFRQGLGSGPVKGEPLIVCRNFKELPSLVNGTSATCLTEQVELVPKNVICQMSFQDDEGVNYVDRAVFQGLFEEHYSLTKNDFSADSRSAWRAKQKSIHMDWAYIITVHKSQGSQWDDVIVVDESSVFRADASKHLYTAVTRAAKTLVILK